jgi:hypothetical protein
MESCAQKMAAVWLFGYSELTTLGQGLSARITNVATEAEAQPFADEYCKARGRLAEFDRIEIVSYRNGASKSALFR